MMTVKLPLSIDELQTISHELNNAHPSWDKIGRITKEGKWNYIVHGLFNRVSPRLLHLVNRVNQTLIHLEQKGVKLFDSQIQNAEYQEKACSYRASRKIYLDVAEKVRQQLSDFRKGHPELEKAYRELHLREVSLRYSLGVANGGLDPLKEPDSAMLADLKERAKEWKKSEKKTINLDFNELEIQRLQELACYPEWIKVVRENPDSLKDVFKWSLHAFNQVEHIVKCPATVAILDNEALLKSNLGYSSNLVLVAKEDEVLAFRRLPTKVAGVAKRVLTAAIYHGSFKKFEPSQQERVNILKPTETIHFKQGNYTLTVAEFLKELGQKNKREANISLCGHWGFVNFHPVKGIWDADSQCYRLPNMTERNWTDQVPAARFASHEEVVAQYGDKVKDRNFFFKVMASRSHLDKNALDCHAFWQLYCRMEDGNWKVLNPGVYAYRFHQNIIDGLWLFCATLKRVLCLMDQNGYYTHRQRGGLAIFPTEEEKEDLLARIDRLRYINGVFQMSGQNCAYAVQTITEQVIKNLPNLFHLPLTECTTGVAPLDRILAWAHRQWEWVRWLIVSMLHSLFLSHRSVTVENDGKKEKHSVRKYFSGQGHSIYNPSYLPYQIAEARKTGQGPFAQGELYWSHPDEKIFQLQAWKAMHQAKPGNSSKSNEEKRRDNIGPNEILNFA
jgi:hypothetical protein